MHKRTIGFLILIAALYAEHCIAGPCDGLLKIQEVWASTASIQQDESLEYSLSTWLHTASLQEINAATGAGLSVGIPGLSIGGNFTQEDYRRLEEYRSQGTDFAVNSKMLRDMRLSNPNNTAIHGYFECLEQQSWTTGISIVNEEVMGDRIVLSVLYKSSQSLEMTFETSIENASIVTAPKALRSLVPRDIILRIDDSSKDARFSLQSEVGDLTRFYRGYTPPTYERVTIWVPPFHLNRVSTLDGDIVLIVRCEDLPGGERTAKDYFAFSDQQIIEGRIYSPDDARIQFIARSGRKIFVSAKMLPRRGGIVLSEQTILGTAEVKWDEAGRFNLAGPEYSFPVPGQEVRVFSAGGVVGIKEAL